MQLRDKEYISYTDIQKQIATVSLLDELGLALDSKEKTIADFIQNLPKLPKEISGISSLHSFVVHYQELIQLTINKRCSLPNLYHQLFEVLCHQENVKQIKKFMRTAVNKNKVSLSSCYQLDLFFKKLTDQKLIMKDAVTKNQQIKKCTEEKLDFQKKCDSVIRISKIRENIINQIEKAFSSEFEGWKEYNEAYNKFCVNFPPVLNRFDKEIFLLEKQQVVRDSMLSNQHHLYQAAMAFDLINQNDLKSIIDFVNIYHASFSSAFNVNSASINQYLENYFSPEFAKNISFNKLSCTNLPKLMIDYQKAHQEFCKINQDWGYVHSLLDDDTPLKDLYRLIALNIKFPKTIWEDFFSMWKNQITDLLVKKDLTAEAKAAVIQAALDCIVDRKESICQYYTTNTGFVRYSDDQAKNEVPDDKQRTALLADLRTKERQYHDEMPADPGFRPACLGEDCYYEYETAKAKVLFLRMIGVHYIRNKILSGDALSPQAITDELVDQFGREIILRRGVGFGNSYLCKILKKLSITECFSDKKNTTEESLEYDQKIIIKKTSF